MRSIEIYEAMVQKEWDNDELHEMANIYPRFHGIKGVVIWVGKANKRHGLRIKVSNIRNKWSDNNFVIQLPSLDYDTTRVANWIKVDLIKEWIKLNQELLYKYETGVLDDTGDFLDQIVKIDK